MMPIGKNDRFEFILREHQIAMTPDAPGETPELLPSEVPVFIFRSLTGREQYEIIEVNETIGGMPESKEHAVLLFDTVQKYMVGWRNISDEGGEVKFDGHNLPDIVSVSMAVEMFAALIFQSPSLGDKKKST